MSCSETTNNHEYFYTSPLDVLFVFSILQLLDSALCRNTAQETNIRSPIQTKSSGVTELPQQIQEGGSGHMQELIELDPSNSTTISKEQFRQLCDRHCLGLTNDQVKPEKLLR